MWKIAKSEEWWCDMQEKKTLQLEKKKKKNRSIDVCITNRYKKKNSQMSIGGTEKIAK